jgi:uncharacterized protein
MRTLQTRLKEFSEQHQIKFEIIEQDYILSWVLFGIANHQILSKILVFKGGTALKKCYFGDYRFSQDLDFTLINDTHYEKLNHYIQEACYIAEKRLDNLGVKCEIICKEYQPESPHPHGQKAYVLFAGLFWHRKPMIKIMIEITRDELIINPAEVKKILHTYGEIIDTYIQVYCLEEIIMEKLRAIVQQIVKMHEKGWGRSRARDFYDIWMIYNKYHDSIDNEKIKSNIAKKFAIKNIEFKSIDDFFDSKYISEVIRTWEQWLKPFVSILPPADIVLNDVRNNILPKIFTK